MSSAACGGLTDMITSARRTSSASPPPTPVSPAAAARAAVAGLRPSGTHSTRCPAPARHCPTAAPISPGCSSPIVVSSMLLISPGARLVRSRVALRRQRRERIPADHADPAVTGCRNHADEQAARGVRPQHVDGQHACLGESPVPEDAYDLAGCGGVLAELGHGAPPEVNAVGLYRTADERRSVLCDDQVVLARRPIRRRCWEPGLKPAVG